MRTGGPDPGTRFLGPELQLGERTMGPQVVGWGLCWLFFLKKKKSQPLERRRAGGGNGGAGRRGRRARAQRSLLRALGERSANSGSPEAGRGSRGPGEQLGARPPKPPRGRTRLAAAAAAVSRSAPAPTPHCGALAASGQRAPLSPALLRSKSPNARVVIALIFFTRRAYPWDAAFSPFHASLPLTQQRSPRASAAPAPRPALSRRRWSLWAPETPVGGRGASPHCGLYGSPRRTKGVHAALLPHARPHPPSPGKGSSKTLFQMENIKSNMK